MLLVLLLSLVIAILLLIILVASKDQHAEIMRTIDPLWDHNQQVERRKGAGSVVKTMLLFPIIAIVLGVVYTFIASFFQ